MKSFTNKFRHVPVLIKMEQVVLETVTRLCLHCEGDWINTKVDVKYCEENLQRKIKAFCAQ